MSVEDQREAMLERLFAAGPGENVFVISNAGRCGIEDVAGLVCLMAGAPMSAPSGRSVRALPHREHHVPEEKLTKRRRRRLRGRAKA